MADETLNPRLIVSGDVVLPKGMKIPEVVRDVSIILHMANGMDYVYTSGEEVSLPKTRELTPTEEEILEAEERRGRQEAEFEKRKKEAEERGRKSVEKDN